MNINRNNYEAFFLDYLEGRLPIDLNEELQIFLQSNPDLAAELNELKEGNKASDFSLDDDVPVFLAKDSLKKSDYVSSENLIDELLAKELEGDLTEDEEKLIDKISKESPLVQKERAIYLKTKLTSTNEVFEEKESLKIYETADESESQNIIIALIEGDLTRREAEKLERKMDANSDLRKTYSLFQHTILKSELIIFPFKKTLYKKVPSTVNLKIFYYSIGIAASIALLIGTFLYSDKHFALSIMDLKPHAEATLHNDNIELTQEKNQRINAHTHVIKETMAVLSDVTSSKQITQTPKIEPEPKNNGVTEIAELQHEESLVNVEENKLPEMKEVFTQPFTQENQSNQSTTLLAYMGKVTTNRLRNSESFSDAENQIELLVNRVNQKFKFERIPLKTKDELFLKIGKLEVRKTVAHKEKSRIKTLWEKVKEKLEENKSE